MASFTATRAQSRSSETAARRARERARDAVVLIMRFLCDQGYTEAYQRLCLESSLSLNKIDVADNMDLLLLMQEFEGMYEANYGRRPRITRNAGSSQEHKGKKAQGGNACKCGSTDNPGKRGRIERSPLGMKSNQEASVKHHTSGVQDEEKEEKHIFVNGFAIQGAKNETMADGSNPQDSHCSFRPLGPLPQDLPGDLHELAQIVARDIGPCFPAVRWNDVAGLETAKRVLKEAVLLPRRYPEHFTGILTPWKGVLLYGPPGTGKTLLARAVAAECESTFFNISASTVTSKWRGDSEKLIRVLFHLARHYSPSVIFMDEVDALMTSRGGEGEHEASRRMKTELMVQLDGLAHAAKQVVVLGASNRPWELDDALLRRMEKKLYVPLPDLSARERILEGLLKERTSSGVCLKDLAVRTESFSGSDLFLLAKESAMRPLRRLIENLEVKPNSGKTALPEVQPITQEDIEGAIKISKPSSRKYQSEYDMFSKMYGQRGDASEP